MINFLTPFFKSISKGLDLVKNSQSKQAGIDSERVKQLEQHVKQLQAFNNLEKQSLQDEAWKRRASKRDQQDEK